MQVPKRRGSTAPFLDLGTRRGWVVSVTPRGKEPPVPIVQEAVWAPERVWRQRLEENSVCLCRGSNLYRPVVHSVVRHYTDWATPSPLLRSNITVLLLIWLNVIFQILSINEYLPLDRFHYLCIILYGIYFISQQVNTVNINKIWFSISDPALTNFLGLSWWRILEEN
jgi:hypothetical protein